MGDAGSLAMFSHTYPGTLVALEGISGAGKSSLRDYLERRCRLGKRSVVADKQPSEHARALPAFRRYMFEPDQRHRSEYRALLATLLADRFEQISETIRPALARGDTVIMDRYVFTMIAMMRARGYEEEWVIQACSLFPRPDVAVLLDLPLDAAIARVSARRGAEESYVEADLLSRLAWEFRRFAVAGALVPYRSDLMPTSSIGEEVIEMIEAS